VTDVAGYHYRVGMFHDTMFVQQSGLQVRRVKGTQNKASTLQAPQGKHTDAKL